MVDVVGSEVSRGRFLSLERIVAVIAHIFRTRHIRARWSAALALGFFFGSIAFGEVTAPPTGKTSATGDAHPFTQKLPSSDVAFDMVPIPAGKFMMGSPATEKGRKADEGPQFEVQVDAFYMQSKPVTWDEYNQYLSNYDRMAKVGLPAVPKDKWADAVTYPTPMYELEAGPALGRMGRPGTFPAVIMSQYAARQYTKWLSKRTGRFYRLATEAEWEYACRAGTTTAYSFGNDIGKDGKIMAEYAWYVDNSNLKDGDPAYRRVGTLKPNPWGLYDMHGNVACWVIDAYDAAWYKKFEGKSVNWHDAINWPTKQYPRVYRGGGYDMDPEECRSASRHSSSRNMNKRDPQLPQSPHWLTEGFSVGFRVVAPLKEPAEDEKNKYWNVDDDYTARVLERGTEKREIIVAPDK
jgi:formylglycine-generating enzyme required for sulfatase activity